MGSRCPLDQFHGNKESNATRQSFCLTSLLHHHHPFRSATCFPGSLPILPTAPLTLRHADNINNPHTHTRKSLSSHGNNPQPKETRQPPSPPHRTPARAASEPARDPPGPGRTRAGKRHLATIRSSGSGGPELHARRPRAAANRSMLAVRPVAAAGASPSTFSLAPFRSSRSRNKRSPAAPPPPPPPLSTTAATRRARAAAPAPSSRACSSRRVGKLGQRGTRWRSLRRLHTSHGLPARSLGWRPARPAHWRARRGRARIPLAGAP